MIERLSRLVFRILCSVFFLVTGRWPAILGFEEGFRTFEFTVLAACGFPVVNLYAPCTQILYALALSPHVDFGDKVRTWWVQGPLYTLNIHKLLDLVPF